jgi:ABC-type antimicrobial peptide transport system permease subunit
MKRLSKVEAADDPSDGAGMILGVLATRVLSSIVYQATPKDPVILGGVILTMLCVGVVAAFVPARRALAVDPMILLRDE